MCTVLHGFVEAGTAKWAARVLAARAKPPRSRAGKENERKILAERERSRRAAKTVSRLAHRLPGGSLPGQNTGATVMSCKSWRRWTEWPLRSAAVQDEGRTASRDLGFQYLANTCVTMFYRMPVLDSTVAELCAVGYHVVQADTSRWLRVRDMHDDLVRLLHFPGYYGYNLDAFNDCMRDVICREYGFPTEATGLAIVFTGYEEFATEFKREAHVLLDIIADQSRHALLGGEQVFCLIQANDPRFTLPAVGAVPLMWNQAEWLNASRGL